MPKQDPKPSRLRNQPGLSQERVEWQGGLSHARVGFVCFHRVYSGPAIRLTEGVCGWACCSAGRRPSREGRTARPHQRTGEVCPQMNAARGPADHMSSAHWPAFLRRARIAKHPALSHWTECLAPLAVGRGTSGRSSARRRTHPPTSGCLHLGQRLERLVHTTRGINHQAQSLEPRGPQDHGRAGQQAHGTPHPPPEGRDRNGSLLPTVSLPRGVFLVLGPSMNFVKPLDIYERMFYSACRCGGSDVQRVRLPGAQPRRQGVACPADHTPFHP